MATLNNVKNQIIAHFALKDTFVVNKDVASISLSAEQERYRAKLVLSVLEDLQNDGFCLGFSFARDAVFVLAEDVNGEDQNVKITPQTAEVVAQAINGYRAVAKIEEGECDASNITEANIQSLVLMCSDMFGELSKIAQDRAKDN